MLLERTRRWLLLAGVAVLAAPLPGRAEDSKAVSVAHIRLAGSLDEAPVSLDPLLSGSSENFKSKLDRIRKARKDPNVRALYLEIDGLTVGWGKVDELSRAITDFRKADKKAFAFVEVGSSKDYLVALACDEVCLPEAGELMLTGIRAEVSFYKDLFEKIGVKADMLQMGDFKAAAEPFMRSSMSEPARKQLTRVIDDYYENSLIKRIAAAREGKGLTPEKVKKLIDEAPFTARAALKAGLIDKIAYSEAFEESLKGRLKADEVKIVRNYGHKKAEDIDFSNPFAIFKLLAPQKITSSKNPKIAVIYAVGAIVTGKSRETLFGVDTVGSTTIVEAIRKAESDETVKAIVLRVDSPGGSALASDLIWNELTRSKKPVIASMSDVAASGGYYISMGARKIYAEPGTLTGSIGVVGGKLAVGGAFSKLGIKTEVISRGANSGVLSSEEPFTASEREAMTTLMKDIYDQFVDKALAGRQKAGKKMSREELLKLAGGRIWTGRQAKENGLIDELGTLDDALADAKKMAGLPADKEIELLILPRSKGLFDSLLESKFESRAPATVAAQLHLLRDLPELQRKLQGVNTLLQLRAEPVWLTLPYQIQID
jgi:protease-4